MKFNKKIVIPAILAVAIYLLAYQIPKIAVDASRLHFLNIPIDDKIPFIPEFMFIYIGAFIQWSCCIYIVFKQETKLGYKSCSALTIGSIIGFIIFMVYPTATKRPEVIGQGISYDLCRLVYSIDNIICAFPSFHCFCSTIIILIYKECKDVSRRFIIVNIIYSILVFASTLFTKQHFIVDIFPGILLAFVSMHISKKFTFTKIYEAINKTILNKKEY